LARQRADYIVRFIASVFKDGNAIRLERSPYVGQLLREIAGHLGAIRFVAVILDLLKCLRLPVKPAHTGYGFRLLITKGGSSHVKNGGQIFRRKVVPKFT